MIKPELIQTICKSLSRGKSVNRKLPKGGKIVVDHVLPYICVYRYSGHDKDDYIAKLIRTQAAYVLAHKDLDIEELLTCVTDTISSRYEATLMIEMWPSEDDHSKIFKILSPSAKAPATTSALQSGLEEIRQDYPEISVEVVDTKERHPLQLRELLSIDKSKEVGCLMIGIEVPPIYKASEDSYYVLLYRKLRMRIANVLKKAAFEFVRVQAGDYHDNYLTLGKSRLNNLINSIDKRIASISEKMNFLMRVSPVNDSAAWDYFKDSGFTKVPAFHYRLIPLDPEVEKRKLYNLRLEHIDDPTVAILLRNKRKELEVQLTMLEARESEAFRHYSQALFGEIPLSTKILAKSILTDTDAAKEQRKSSLDCHGFAARANAAISIYQKEFDELRLAYEIRQDISGLMVSKSNLLIGENLNIDEARAEALIEHEVGTHILTYCNGKRQPLHQMYAGLDGYDQLQEGLAVLAEYLVGGLTASRLRLLAARVIAADMMMKDAGFLEVYHHLHDDLQFSDKQAFDITTRIFRGGGFTKDAVYLRGLEDLLEFLKNDGRLETLYIGKFDLKHVPLIEELLQRGVLRPAVLPKFLERADVKARIEKVKNGLSPVELLNQSLIKTNNESSIYN